MTSDVVVSTDAAVGGETRDAPLAALREVVRLRSRVVDAEAEATRALDGVVAIGEALGYASPPTALECAAACSRLRAEVVALRATMRRAGVELAGAPTPARVAAVADGLAREGEGR